MEKEASLDRVQDTFYADFNPPGAGTTVPSVWTKAVFPTFVVAEDAGKLYRVPYTTEGDIVKFVARADWEQVELRYEPVATPAPPPVVADTVPHSAFWESNKEARMFLAAAKAWLQRKESETVVWKEGARRFYLGLVSLAFKDKEGELVTREGADFSIDLSQRYEYHGGLYIKHVVPESLVGRSIRERRIGPFWVEFGEFKNTPLADWAYHTLENDTEGKWKFSIGFITPKRQALMGHYTRLLKFDSTITEVPAQPFTAMLALMEGDTNTMKSTSVQKLMTFLNPETDEEKDQFASMVADIFEVDKEEVVIVAKQAEATSEVMAAIEALEDEGLKKKLLADLDTATPKKEPEPKKSEDVEAAIAKALEPVLERIEAIEGTASAMKELREALLTRSKDHVKPSETATPVADGDELLKKLEKMLDPEAGRGKHPLSAFAGGPSPAEGG